MNFNSDYDESSDFSGWVKQSQFKKDVKKNNVITAERIQTKNFEQHKISKSCPKPEPIPKLKKLVFRERKKKETVVAVEVTQAEEKCFSAVHSPDKSSFRPPKIIEFKKGEDGYGLIAFDESEIPNGLSDSESESDYWTDSISDMSLEIKETEETEEASYTRNTFQYSYKRYLLMWNDINAGVKYEYLPLPIHYADELNDRAVAEFVIDPNNLKNERIRWHPDKMKNVLKKNGMLNTENEHKVTHVFQVINEAFEKFYC